MNGYNIGNWLSLLRSDSCDKWYWQYMNYGAGNARFARIAQKVFNAPFKPSEVNAGVPDTTSFNSVVFLVYVPPTTPPPAQTGKGPGFYYEFKDYWYKVFEAIGRSGIVPRCPPGGTPGQVGA